MHLKSYELFPSSCAYFFPSLFKLIISEPHDPQVVQAVLTMSSGRWREDQKPLQITLNCRGQIMNQIIGGWAF